MFDNLANRLQNIFSKLKSSGVLTEKNIAEALREVRLALLEADVNFKVVKSFTSKIKEKASGKEVLQSLTPGQQVIKIVHDELTSLLGGATAKIELAAKPPTMIMLCGLQGSGKTSTIAKLGLNFRKKGSHPLLVAADTYRPAAIDQLIALGKELDIPVYSNKSSKPTKICQEAINQAAKDGLDVILFDTAGRMHIDNEMMEELVAIKKVCKPHQILLVVDSTIGQDAVKQASAFKEKLSFDGLIMTKLDGDARGGAALSINSITNAPIKYVATGEKADALELFHPDRMASRILGMGDIVTLVEKTQAGVDEEKAKQLEEKIRKASFTLDDLLQQMQQLKNMGPLDQVLGMIPGIKSSALKHANLDEKQLTRMEVIIKSMTRQEREHPSIINGSRRKRIAQGSGTQTRDINLLLKQFEQTKKLMASFGKQKGKLKYGKGFPF
ncbi:MAG: signal recognition particle protein [Actinobacteria bacterium]|nr:MAG: signal recognition particle protein [Actinomycetota bacterium]